MLTYKPRTIQPRAQNSIQVNKTVSGLGLPTLKIGTTHTECINNMSASFHSFVGWKQSTQVSRGWDPSHVWRADSEGMHAHLLLLPSPVVAAEVQHKVFLVPQLACIPVINNLCLLPRCRPACQPRVHPLHITPYSPDSASFNNYVPPIDS